jgi:dipeptidyl aminopeptidase/acylaminoacyl peptidase
MNSAVSSLDLTYASGGAPVPARLYRSAEAGPGVLLCAGRFRNIDGLAFIAEALARRGRIVLATTYRGMDLFTDDEDARAGLDYLERQPGVDAARLALVGHSRGGMCALRTAAQDERVRSVVALAPPTDFVSYIRAMQILSPMRYAGLIQSMGGPPEAQPERYRQISALNYADRVRVPVLLVVGTQDLHAPLDHSKWMHDAILQAGNPRCRLETLDGVGHFFERMYFGYEFERVAALAADWLDETVGPADGGRLA